MTDWIMCRCPRCGTTFELQTRSEDKSIGDEPTLLIDREGDKPVTISCPECGFTEKH